MPEHREGTPQNFRSLESFLWHDFGTGQADWLAWNHRHMPDVPEVKMVAAQEPGLQLHRALRAMQAWNSGIESEEEVGQPSLDGLITCCGIRPQVSAAGRVVLVAPDQDDPASRLLLLALEAMQLGLWSRFKLCREPTCRASYYDASRAAVKTWCSMETCGSRNKMRRYRSKSLSG